jgi:cation diffusion facilitator family transporter
MNTLDVHPSVKAIRATQIGIAISIMLVFVKGAAGHFGHSYALIADATETGADVFSSTLLWVGLKIAIKPADTRHPYGHGKAEPIASIIIAFFLMGAALWIGWHALELVRTPHPMPRSFTLYVLLFVIIIKEGMFRYVLKLGNEINSSAVKADAHHHRSDAITSVAAFIGISIALIAGKGYEGADDWAALLASGLIFYNSIQLLRPGLAEIMDAAPSSEIVDSVRLLAGEVKEVKFIEKCFVRKMGFDYFVDLHIQIDAHLTVSEGHRISHLVKDRLLESSLNIKNVLIHVEPYEVQSALLTDRI